MGTIDGGNGQQGRAETFIQLLEPCRHALYSLALSLLWNKQGVEDVIQDAVMAAYRGFDAFEPGTNFRAWISRYLVNTIFNLNKKTRRRPEVRLTNEEMEVLAAPESPSAPGFPTDPEGCLEQVTDPVKRAILNLPQTQRSVLLLHAVGDLKYREIADLMKTPIGTIMSTLSRVRTRLRAELAGLDLDEGLVRG